MRLNGLAKVLALHRDTHFGIGKVISPYVLVPFGHFDTHCREIGSANMPVEQLLLHVLDGKSAYKFNEQTAVQLPVVVSAYVGGLGGHLVTQEYVKSSLNYPIEQFNTHYLYGNVFDL